MLYSRVVHGQKWAPWGSWRKEKPCDLQGFSVKRLKRLEPSTFCMAIAKIDVDFRWNKGKAYIYRAFRRVDFGPEW